MKEPTSLEFRLIRALAVIAAIAVVGVLAILPYRLYERDIRHARVEAHRVASTIHVALSDAIGRGEDVTGLVNRLQSVGDFEIGLRRLAADEAVPQGSRRGALVQPLGTDFSYVAPPILDADGRTWLLDLHFDLSAVRRDSVDIIIDLVLAVVLGSAVFSAGIFLLVRRGLLEPLRQVTRDVARIPEGGGGEELPRYASRELRELAETVERVCRTSPG